MKRKRMGRRRSKANFAKGTRVKRTNRRRSARGGGRF